MPLDKDFNGTIKLTTGYELTFDKEDMRKTLNILSLSIVGELSNKHLFATETPSSEKFEQAVFDEINHILSEEVADDQAASALVMNMLFWHLLDRFFSDMAASLFLEGETRERFLRRDWSLISGAPSQGEGEEDGNGGANGE